MSDQPEYLICLTCDTPLYEFEFENGKITAALCLTCGNDDPAEFMTETEYEEQQS